MRRTSAIGLILAASLAAGWMMTAREVGLVPASREVRRVQAHLLGAERVMAGRDVSRLTPEQRAARARLVGVLDDYRRRGEFPRNHDFPDERRPYFIDAHGTRCAMAHLIERSGGAAIVARIARERNNATVRELAGDPELTAWLDRNGITAAEAARVQPAYDYTPPKKDRNVAEYLSVGSTLALEVLMIRANATHDPEPDSRNRPTFGAITGILGTAIGIAQIRGGELSDAWGAGCVGLGVTSWVLAARRATARGPARGPGSTIVGVGLWHGRSGEPGLAVRAQF